MINWLSFGIVAAASIAFTLVIVSGFSLGVRFLTNSENLVKSAKKGNADAIRKEALNRMAAYVLFALCSMALLYGIYLVIPSLHK
jgi:hypothetical protein